MQIKNEVRDQIESGHIVIWIRRVIAVILIASVLYTIYTVWDSDLLPLKYMLPVGILAVALTAASVALLFKRSLSTRSTILSILLAAILLACSYASYTVVRTADSFISSVTTNSAARYETYGVIALREGDTDFYDDEDFSIAISAMDAYKDEVRSELARKSDASITESENLTSLATSLMNSEADLVTVNVSHLDLINENIPEFEEQTHTVHTFKVRVEGVSTDSIVDGNSPFILYISGVDTYGSMNASARSDVNMLAVVNPEDSSILLINTPRDYYVQLAGTEGTRDKLTHAGIYGVETSVATLEQLYGIDIDRHLKVNFTTLVNVVDAIGGITVKSDYAFSGFQVGDNHVNGRRALEFSRERYEFQDGDFQRGRNQQRVIEGIIAKLSNPQTLLSYQDILLSFQGSIQSNMESSAIKNLINNQLSDMNAWSVESISVDGTGGHDSTYSMGATPLYVIYPDENSIFAAKDSIARTLGL